MRAIVVKRTPADFSNAFPFVLMPTAICKEPAVRSLSKNLYDDILLYADTS